MTARVRVLVVDDSAVVRRLVTSVLDADPDLEVVGTAASGELALASVGRLAPDVITLDIEMPGMDGIETLRGLRAMRSRVPVIMFSTLTERGAAATLEALSLGARDYVTKPSNTGSIAESTAEVRAQLIPRIKALHAAATVAATPRAPAVSPRTAAPRSLPVPPARRAVAAVPALRQPVPLRPRPPGVRPGTAEVVVVGASTGGPDALATLLSALPEDLAVPVLCVQHMPAVFTRMFAQRLDARCGLEVKEAEAGDVVRPGLVLLAPGDHHLRLRRRGTEVVAVLDQGEPENYSRPAVDVLFRSAADLWGGRVHAVVLTGMGSDGRRGAEQLHALGARVTVQDEASSVVWGMPGAVAAAGVADDVLPLESIAETLVRALDVRATVGRRS